MKNFFRFSFFLFFITLLFPLYAQQLSDCDYYENVFLYAEKLFNNQSEEEAITEYKRYLFLQNFCDTNNSSQNKSCLQNKIKTCFTISEYYKKHEVFQTSYDYFLRAKNFLQGNLSLNQKIEEIKLITLISENEKTSVLENPSFFAYCFFPDENSELQNYALLKLLSNNLFLNDWQSFIENYNFTLQNHAELFSEDEISEINHALQNHNSFKPKNLKLAGYLSIIPGLGQLYANNPQDALNAFLLDGSLITLCTISLINLQFWDLSLLELNPTLNFYRGNLYNAQKDAHLYNQKINTEHITKITNILTQKQSAFLLEKTNK